MEIFKGNVQLRRPGLKPSPAACLTCMTRSLVQYIFQTLQSKESRNEKTRSDKSWEEPGELTRIHCTWTERTKELYLLQIVQNKNPTPFGFSTSLYSISLKVGTLIHFLHWSQHIFNVRCRHSVVHEGNACLILKASNLKHCVWNSTE